MRSYRVGFIGDVHGHARELEKIIRQMEDHGIDRLISLGDLFDRGPDAPKCLRIIKDRNFKRRDGTIGKIEMVLGNHEDRNIRCWKKIPIPGRKAAPSPVSPREFKKIKKKEWEWLESLPFMIRIREHGLDLVAVHGGFTKDMVSPGWYNFDKSGRMARVGYLSEKSGSPLSPLQFSSRLWADEYDGRFGRAVYGHTSFSEVRYSKHAVGIDGSKRGKLFGIVISNDAKDKVFEVPFAGWKPPAPKKSVERDLFGDDLWPSPRRKRSRSRSETYYRDSGWGDLVPVSADGYEFDDFNQDPEPEPEDYFEASRYKDDELLDDIDLENFGENDFFKYMEGGGK